MPRQSGTLVENNFTRGLITESSALAFPKDACTETWNCVFEPSGKVKARPGFRYEEGNFYLAVDRVEAVFTEYVWRAVSGEGNRTFIVQQVGGVIRFYELAADSTISSNLKEFAIDLNQYMLEGAFAVHRINCQFASGRGYLFVAHPSIDPLYIEYDVNEDELIVSSITINIRDMEGVDDPYEIWQRPTDSLDPYHNYNLFNQGWGVKAVKIIPNMTTGIHTTLPVFPIDNWNGEHTDFPSNSDVPWLVKDPTYGGFNADYRDVSAQGNTPAAKGHFILNAFEQDRTAVASADYAGYYGAIYPLDIPVVSSFNNRPSCIQFFAGRVWYAGVSWTKFNSNIYFSQIIERDDQIGDCYQALDPTSENADLLPTDGGIVIIPEIGTIKRLFPMGPSLLVFATNGVWSISGSEGSGFKANDYSVQKVSSVGAISALNFVDVEGIPFWWNNDGIYSASQNELGTVTIQSIVETTIRSFIQDIPPTNFAYVKGAYNPLTKVIQWLYNTVPIGTLSGQFNYNRVLNFNMTTGAFYPWSIQDDAAQKINGIFCTGNPLSFSEGSSKFFYTTTQGHVTLDWIMTFSICDSTDYIDWDASTYESYGIAGYKLDGEGNKDFQSNYVTVYLENDENASLKIQGLWDFSKNNTTSRWSVAQQAYLFADADDYSVVFRKLKIRGRGKSLQIKFTGESGKPFTLLGWSIYETSNAQP